MVRGCHGGGIGGRPGADLGASVSIPARIFVTVTMTRGGGWKARAECPGADPIEGPERIAAEWAAEDAITELLERERRQEVKS